MIKFTDEEKETILNALDLLVGQVSIGGVFPEFERKIVRIREKLNDKEK